MLKKLVFVGGTSSLLYFTRTEQEKKDLSGFYNGVTNSFSAIKMVLLSLYDYQYTLSKFEYNSQEYHDQRSIIHQRVADRILYLSIKNKGVYLKAGQYIGNLERVMPREFTQTLRVLQDQGPQTTFEDVKIVIEHEMRDRIDNVFSHFDHHAIAAASLAQVHKAKLKSQDRDVAVKVQFPWLRTQYKYDLMIIDLVARLSDYALSFNKQKPINFQGLFSTFRRSLEKELNFVLEAENGRKTAEQFKGNKEIYIPEYYQATQRVLVMEFIDGVKINEVNKLKNPKECARILIDLFGQMIFKFGHVHCDAHPGNILIRLKDGREQLVLLDHGFYTDVDPEQLQLFRLLWINIAKFNYVQVAKYAKQLGIKEEHIEFLPLIFFYRTINSKKKLGDAFSVEERSYLRTKDLVTLENISELLLSMPPEIMFIIRAANLVGIHNAMLGGTTRQRLIRFTEFAAKESRSSLFEWIKIKVVLAFFELFGFLIRI